MIRRTFEPHVSGGGGGIRTPDLYSAIVALSQLSYAPATALSIRGGAGCRQRGTLSQWVAVEMYVWTGGGGHAKLRGRSAVRA